MRTKEMGTSLNFARYDQGWWLGSDTMLALDGVDSTLVKRSICSQRVAHAAAGLKFGSIRTGVDVDSTHCASCQKKRDS